MITIALPEAPQKRDRSLQVAAAMRSLRHPHIAGYVTVAEPTDGVVRLDPVPDVGTSLAVILAAGPLSAGQVVTLGVPIAQALAAAAQAGVQHGGLDAGTVVIDGLGRPLLAGLGLSQLSGAVVLPADDVHALARLLRACLPASGDAVLEAVLAPALSGHVAARPSAADLADALMAACPPAPLAVPHRSADAVTGSGAEAGVTASPQIAAGGDDPVPPGVRRVPPPPLVPRRTWLALSPTELWVGVTARLFVWLRRLPGSRGLAGGLVALAVVVVGLIIALASGGSGHHENVVAHPSAGAGSAVSTKAATVEWSAQVQGLAAARQAAFAAGDASLLAAVDAPGSAAMAVDTQRLGSWTAAGAVLRGSEPAVELLSVTAEDASNAVLRVRERVAAYDVVDRVTGVVMAHHPELAAQVWQVHLQHRPEGWRTVSVTAG